MMAIPKIILKNINDSHHYWVDGVYCYSVTALLSQAAPTAEGLKNFFLSNTADSAEKIRDEAAEFGTSVHNGCEDLLLGNEIVLDERFPTKRGKDAMMSFLDWYDFYKPTNIRTEHKVGCTKLKLAGTLDLFCKINGLNCLVDFKTSSQVYLNHELQIACYKELYERMYGVKIDRTYVLRIGSKHRIGYEFKEVKRPFSDFMNVYNVFLSMNNGKIPDPPKIKKYPKIIKLTNKEEII